MMQNKSIKWIAGLLLLGLSPLGSAVNIKQKLEQEGFKFIQKIEAPAAMTGWAGHLKQNPATVFIANNQQYYIVGNIHNANGENLSAKALDRYVKQSVLDDVWKDLEQSTWIQDGSTTAPKIIYVFSDPNCPYCHAFWEQARPYVKAGKAQLRHIQVAVIRPESKGQAAALLMAKNPAATFESFNQSKGQYKLEELKTIPAYILKKLDHNQQLMEQYQFFSTPAVVWKNKDGELETVQGLPKDMDVVFN